jgi:hypothetical protein
VSTWILRQWPVPLVVATALIVLLAAHRFGVVNVPILQDSAEWSDASGWFQYHQRKASDWCEQSDRAPHFPPKCEGTVVLVVEPAARAVLR